MDLNNIDRENQKISVQLKMLTSFHTSANKTFILQPKSNQLKSLPLLCSTKSAVYPHILPQVSSLYPQIKLVGSDDTIPLFFTVKDGRPVNPTDLGADDKFYLIFFPDNENPPNVADTPVAQEYWSTIQPMTICRGLGNYFLGPSDCDERIQFQKCSEHESQAYISLACSDADHNTCYQYGPTSGSNIYLKRA